MPPAARISDLHTCPMSDGPKPHVGGPIVVGAPTVLTGLFPQARVGDMCVCVGPPDAIAMGCPTVLVNSMMAARMGDQTVHAGVITLGFPTVLIGDGSSGSSSPGSAAPLVARMGVEGAAADQAASAKVMIDAAKSGKPFCEQCAKGA